MYSKVIVKGIEPTFVVIKYRTRIVIVKNFLIIQVHSRNQMLSLLNKDNNELTFLKEG